MVGPQEEETWEISVGRTGSHSIKLQLNIHHVHFTKILLYIHLWIKHQVSSESESSQFLCIWSYNTILMK